MLAPRPTILTGASTRCHQTEGIVASKALQAVKTSASWISGCVLSAGTVYVFDLKHEEETFVFVIFSIYGSFSRASFMSRSRNPAILHLCFVGLMAM
jgi:hypothetical protein